MSKESRRTEWEVAQALVASHVRQHGTEQGVQESLANGNGLRTVARAVGIHATMHGIDFTAVGGRGVYAAGLAAAVAMELDTAWFRVREKRKDHGTERVTEGARIQEQPVLVVDTVALTGQGGLLELCDLVQTEAGGRIMGVVPLVGLDDQVREEFTANFPGVIYAPLFSHQALQDL